MKVCLVHPYVVATSDPESKGIDYYHQYSVRFMESYRKFKPKIPHYFVVVSTGGPLPGRALELYDGIQMTVLPYYGKGWCEGAYQYAANALDCDLMVCLVASIHFHREGWLERFVQEAEQSGEGLYGAFGSYENRPHLRSCAIACSPDLFRSFPKSINNKTEAYRFESWEGCFTDYVESQNKPVRLVTWDGSYPKDQWRTPDNLFRKGDQSSCLVWDYHCDVFFKETENNRDILTKIADGKQIVFPNA